MNTRSLLLPVSTLLLTALAAGISRAQTPPLAPPPEPATPPALTSPQGKVTPTTGAADIANEPTVKVVANVLPAVVNITTQKTMPQYVDSYDRYFRLYRGVINRTAQSIGSGLLISADGYILTNAHVVALADKETPVGITLSSGSKYQAHVIAADEEADLALVKIDDKSSQFPYYDLACASPNYLGETVIALGSPEGYQNSVSQGILSAKGRTFTAEDHTYTNLIQTDAAINPGNSGGPLVDLNGGLVGINSAKMAGEAIENIGFAIPHDVVTSWANEALAVAKGLKAAPEPVTVSILGNIRQHLGLTLKTLTPEKAEELDLQIAGGLLITGVERGSAAAAAGLREGMIIVGLGDRQVVDEKSLPRELQNLQPGTDVQVQVVILQSLGPISFQRGGSAILTAR